MFLPVQLLGLAHVDDSIHSTSFLKYQAQSLTERMEMGILMAERRSSGHHRTAASRDRWRLLRGGAGWCDGFIERVFLTVSAFTQSERKCCAQVCMCACTYECMMIVCMCVCMHACM